MLSRYLDTVGDGTGTKTVTGNHATTVAYYKIQPPQNKVYELHRMLVFIRDNTAPAAEEYGGIASGLTNGLGLEIRDQDGTVTDLLDGIKIKSNADYQRVCYDMTISEFGAGDNFVAVRWTFAKSGRPIKLRGDNGDRLVLIANDDFTTLIDHTFLIQGQSFDYNYRGNLSDKSTSLMTVFETP